MPDYSLLGLFVVMAGIAIIFIAAITSTRREPQDKADVKAAGVVMIGPVPIIFGTDIRWVVVAIILAIILVAMGFLTSLW